MSPAERLAEAARELLRARDMAVASPEVAEVMAQYLRAMEAFRDALAAFDAAAPRRAAKQAVIEAAKEWEKAHDIDDLNDWSYRDAYPADRESPVLWAAVRALRDIEQ